jgi:hypothetical protein
LFFSNSALTAYSNVSWQTPLQSSGPQPVKKWGYGDTTMISFIYFGERLVFTDTAELQAFWDSVRN